MLAVVLGGGTASAGVDNTSSITDVKGNRIEVFQADTIIHVFPPLDSSPLSVEFFHDGVAGVKIDGPDAASFTGTKLTIGYQIGYPIALTGATVVLNSPGLDWAVESGTNLGIGLVPDFELGLDISNGFVIGGDIIPSQELDVDLAPIGGLYAAGEMVGGIFYNNYPGGTGLMAGAVFGKLAGSSAARGLGL